MLEKQFLIQIRLLCLYKLIVSSAARPNAKIHNVDINFLFLI